MRSLEKKVAVVTGAASGIGRSLAQQFAAAGCQVAICDIDESGLAETLASLGDGHYSEIVDVANKDAVFSFASNAENALGAAHIIVNNAGVAVSQTVEEISYEDFEWIMGINFWGVVHGTKAFLPQIRKNAEGAVVNISSVFGLFAVPTQGSYNAAKFAVRGFTEALRHEMADTDVDVICVHPGGIRTNIVRNARFYVGPDGDSGFDQSVRSFEKMARTTPDAAAARIIKGIRQSESRVLVGPDAVVMDKIQRSAPVRYWSLLGKLMEKAGK